MGVDVVQDVHMRTVIRRRPGIALVAYACLLAQVSTFAHHVLVQHVTCAEHGEAVHVAALAHSADVQSLSSSRASLPPRASGVPASVADDHDHCSIVLSSSLRAPSRPYAGVGPAVSCLPVTIPSSRVSGTGVDTYLIAPKTSPPGRAVRAVQAVAA